MARDVGGYDAVIIDGIEGSRRRMTFGRGGPG